MPGITIKGLPGSVPGEGLNLGRPRAYLGDGLQGCAEAEAAMRLGSGWYDSALRLSYCEDGGWHLRTQFSAKEISRMGGVSRLSVFTCAVVEWPANYDSPSTVAGAPPMLSWPGCRATLWLGDPVLTRGSRIVVEWPVLAIDRVAIVLPHNNP